MADQLGVGNGSGTPSSGPLLQLSLANLRALAGLLKPGEVISGRVEQALGGDLYAFTVRGQTVVASSQMPLLADSVLRFQVLTAADGQLALRLMDQTATDQALTSDLAGRARQLGLPPGPAATAVVAAFEAAGAPLQGVRVQAAVASVAAVPPEQAPRLAQAFAVLARADLPVTDALLSLALHAEGHGLPDPASATLAVQRVMMTGNAPLLPGSPLPMGAPLSQAGATGPTVGTAMGTAPPTAGIPGPLTSPPAGAALGEIGPTTDPRSPLPTSVSLPAAVTTAPLAATPPPATTSPATAPATMPPAATSGTPLPTTTGTATPVPMAPAPTAELGGERPAPTSVASGPVVQDETAALQVAVRSSSVASAPAPVSPQLLSRAEIAVRLLTHLRLPDAVVDGAAGVQQALALAGVRPRRGSGDVSTPPPTLVRQLADALPAVAADVERSSGDVEARQAPIPGLGEAIVGAVREHTAETVFKPQALADYDHVVPLPLLAQGQPTPARLAVAERQTAAGTATFLRVDAELSRLGPVSVRLSGIEGGALTITLFANGASGPVLAAGLPDLAESLRQIGVVAGLRVADLATEDGHG